MIKFGKKWGETSPIIQNPFCELHRIEANKGTKCSKHIHKFKTNLFFVEQGKLLIRVWREDQNLIDETILGPQDYTEVGPNIYHQFEALEDTIAFELYYPQQIQQEDINRKKEQE